jgi:hypothetical protein
MNPAAEATAAHVDQPGRARKPIRQQVFKLKATDFLPQAADDVPVPALDHGAAYAIDVFVIRRRHEYMLSLQANSGPGSLRLNSAPPIGLGLEPPAVLAR